MKKILILLILTSFKTFTAQASFALQVINIAQLQDSMKVNAKPVIIYYHTNWCKYCMAMDHSTLEDSLIIEQLNKQYYFVKFDGQCKDDVNFLGKKYSFIPTGNKEGYHEFNFAFAKITTYPSFVILSERLETLEVSVGYFSKKHFLKLINKY